MKHKMIFIPLIVLFGTLVGAAIVNGQGPQPDGARVSSAAMGAAFTYQGQLKSGGSAYSGTCDFQFKLFDDPSAGAQIGATQTASGVSVSSGVFTTQLDFGAGAFDGNARWLDISVRCPAGSGSYTALSPRQELTATPYAQYAQAAPWAGLTGIPAGFADDTDNDTTYTAGTGLSLNGTQFSIVTSVIQARVTGYCSSGNAVRAIYVDGSVSCEAIPAASNDWSRTGNSGTTAGTNFIGTTDNQSLEFKVNSVRAFRLEPNGTSPNVIGGNSGNSVTNGVYGATIGGGGGTSGNTNRVTDNYGTVGGGYGNQAGDNAGTTSDTLYTVVSGGYYNFATGSFATIGGGSSNNASGINSTIGGGTINIASSTYATVGGGYHNTASGSTATIGGGADNIASNSYDTIGGGTDNTASGAQSTVSGGSSNTASSSESTVSGGASNTASGNSATVSGGYSNLASGYASTVGGGYDNTAAGSYSFVVGRRAKNSNANYDGVFLFADSNNFDFFATTANQFRVRSTGGAQFASAIDGSGNPTAGVQLAAGGGSWSSISDRAVKENFAAVNSRELLARVAAMPIQTWNYKSQDLSTRHIGPMAQDFYAAFGVGEDDKHITTIDADGVALGAIQGLYQVVQDKDAELAGLRSQVADLESQNSKLETRLAALEQGQRAPSSPFTSAESMLAPLGILTALISLGVVQRARRRDR